MCTVYVSPPPIKRGSQMGGGEWGFMKMARSVDLSSELKTRKKRPDRLDLRCEIKTDKYRRTHWVSTRRNDCQGSVAERSKALV